MLSINKLIKILDRLPSSVKVASFDIFDTLLIRLVPSDQVTRICIKNLCERYNQEISSQLSFPDILNHRILFKQKMDERSIFEEAEWTVSQWLNNLSRDMSVNAESLNRIGLQSEIDAEISCLKKADDAEEALDFARKRGLTVVATSDTWIDQNWLQKLLENFGLHFDYIFSSGTIGLSKRKGTIFKEIEKQFRLKPQSFLHVGDNLKADFIRPRLSGWHSVWMPKSENAIQFRKPAIIRKYFEQKESWRDILKILRVEPQNKSSNIYYRMAYDYLAPLLIIFSIVQWRHFRDQKIEFAYYIARDARILLDVYDILSEMLPGSCPRRYIRLSRRAVAIAHPDNYLQNVKHLAGKIGKKYISHWLSNFAISDELRRNILIYAGLDENAVFTESTRKSIISACQKYFPEIVTEQSAQKKLIRDYLLQEGSGVSFGRVGIVDSGWACTTQDTIQGLLPETEVVSGMYFGVSYQGMRPDSRNLKYGLLRDDFRNCKHHNPLESTAGVIRLWDTILREPAQTVLTLQRTPENRIVPVFNKNQILEKLEKQSANDIHFGIHDGTTARVKQASILIKLSEQYTDADFEMAATVIAKNISSHPSRQLAKAVLNLGFDEGAADGSIASFGLRSLYNGIAWYPGILSAAGVGFVLPVITFTAGAVLPFMLKKQLPNSAD